MRVSVYFNLHRKTYSCVAMEGPWKGRVIAYSDNVTLRDVSFVVQPAGRAKVLRERKKNVHAFARGTLMNSALFEAERATLVSYNPYRAASFTRLDNDAPVHKAEAASLAVGRPPLAVIGE